MTKRRSRPCATGRVDQGTVPVWHEGFEIVDGLLRCPECQAFGVVMLTATELAEHMAPLGRAADLRAVRRLLGATCWWCHACSSGGVMVLD